MTEKSREYTERHSRWQEFSITQLGYTSNLIITLCTAFLAFAFTNYNEFLSTISFECGSQFSSKMLMIIITIISLLTSILFGVLTSISRLYDFRITRNIALARKRYYDKFENKPNALPIFEFPKPNCKQRWKALCRVLRNNIDFIERKDIQQLSDNKITLKKFNKLRRLSDTLGVLTWKLFYKQSCFFLISLIAYAFTLFL